MSHTTASGAVHRVAHRYHRFLLLSSLHRLSDNAMYKYHNHKIGTMTKIDMAVLRPSHSTIFVPVVLRTRYDSTPANLHQVPCVGRPGFDNALVRIREDKITIYDSGGQYTVPRMGSPTCPTPELEVLVYPFSNVQRQMETLIYRVPY